MTEDFVCPRCGQLIDYKLVESSDPSIAVHKELVWHTACWDAFIDNHSALPHKLVDPGHSHTHPGMVTEDSGFDIDEHLAALPAGVRADYERAVKK